MDAHFDELLLEREIALDEVEMLQQLGVVSPGPPDVLEDDGPRLVVLLATTFLLGFGERSGSFPHRSGRCLGGGRRWGEVVSSVQKNTFANRGGGGGRAVRF